MQKVRTVGDESLYSICIDSGIGVVTFATLESLVGKNTIFPYL
jgi:hypothetical protein